MSQRMLRISLGVFLLSSFPTAWLMQPGAVSSGTTICLFRTITGKPGAFCGLTRAFVSAAHGEFQAAFAFHHFWWAVALVIAVVGLSALTDGLTGSDYLHQLRLKTAFAEKYVIGFLILFSLYRLFVS